MELQISIKISLERKELDLILNKVVKNDFTKNKHKKDKDQALTSGTNEDK